MYAGGVKNEPALCYRRMAGIFQGKGFPLFFQHLLECSGHIPGHFCLFGPLGLAADFQVVHTDTLCVFFHAVFPGEIFPGAVGVDNRPPVIQDRNMQMKIIQDGMIYILLRKQAYHLKLCRFSAGNSEQIRGG